jgi:hypothetical protein
MRVPDPHTDADGMTFPFAARPAVVLGRPASAATPRRVSAASALAASVAAGLVALGLAIALVRPPAPSVVVETGPVASETVLSAMNAAPSIGPAVPQPAAGTAAPTSVAPPTGTAFRP